MTNRKIEYWVILPEADAEFVATWKKCSKRTQNRMIAHVRCFAWTSNPSN